MQKRAEQLVVVSLVQADAGLIQNVGPVSYTHLDVYKRQISYSIGRNYSRRDFMINNNLAAPERFDRYFALALENDAIPTNACLLYTSRCV